MKKLVFILSLIFSIQGFITNFFFLFINSKLYLSPIGKFVFFTPYFFQSLPINYVTEISDNSSSYINLHLINVFFCILFFVGSLLYYFTKYTEVRLLLFSYSLILIYSLVSIFYIVCDFTFLANEFNNVFLVKRILFTVFRVAISIFIIKKYLFIKSPSTYIEIENGKEIEYLKNSSKSKRFLHLIIDTGLIFIVFYNILNYVQQLSYRDHNFYDNNSNIIKSEFTGLFIILIIKFTYYFVFETLFSSSPSKFLTMSVVTDEDGENVKNINIFFRTLCRFVPLESFTFLAGYNFHDKHSDTFVIDNEKKTQNYNSYYVIGIIALFLIFLFIYIYKNFIQSSFY